MLMDKDLTPEIDKGILLLEYKDLKHNFETLKMFYDKYRSESEFRVQKAYERGWKNCCKKIRNFIIRHCEEYENINADTWIDDVPLELQDIFAKIH